MRRLLRNFREKFVEKPQHKYHLLIPTVAPVILDPDEYDESHDQDSDKAIIEKFNLIKRQLPKLADQAKLKEETAERERLRRKSRNAGSVKLLRYVRSDKPRKYEIELTNMFEDQSTSLMPVSMK
ncbi:Oidioi.mRNA.OKI2018_I69.chr2.g7445.t1.cds [Oikopleura dioica]|uniref:Oidioi.mRNA.OKI2018_I69.chr2.g7445.t1.cds n=1 Tax=Oikopleura dioica TaxID=34765 RepID=A0ABN7T784_OIKDI|nr:Oidioi.mRNA.OKI2018_I69.chr2.g7445.t1.cds [Oikopleura dioica]